MYRFESKHKSHDVGGDPVVHFENYEYSTDDEKIAERLRRNKDIWEITPDIYRQQIEEGNNRHTEAPRRRGRPPKVAIVTGIKTSETI